MNAERILTEPKRIEAEIRILIKEIDRERLALLPGGINYEIDRVQGGGGGDRYAGALDKILEKEKRILRLNTRRLWLKNELIPELIAGIKNDMARDVIRLYYGESDLTMAQIEKVLHISNATVYRYRRLGLGEVERLLQEKSKK